MACRIEIGLATQTSLTRGYDEKINWLTKVDQAKDVKFASFFLFANFELSRHLHAATAQNETRARAKCKQS